MTGPRPRPVRVGLSTASVFPAPAEEAFRIAAELGYDGVEVMVWTDPVSQDAHALRRLSTRYAVPVLAIHSPCLIVTQRVWGMDPWVKLEKAQFAAELLGARTVVVHPPFRWQRDYGRRFHEGIAEMRNRTDVRFAVENMFPLRVRDLNVSPYDPTWDVTADAELYPDYTLDLSHTAVSRSDALAMLGAMGDRLGHLHVADGTGVNKDEHLVPGRGSQPVADVLERAAAAGFDGHAIVEINTRRAATRDERLGDAADALAFCRRHLAR